MFGPPQRFTIASTCSWLGHSVSGLRHDTLHPIQIRFRFGFVSLTLNPHHIVTRRPILQKVRDHTRMVLSLLVSSRFQVLFHSPPGVLFTFPSRYYSLSVTWSYLAFGDGPPFFRQDFSCPDVLRILLAPSKFRLRGCHPLCLTFPGNSTIHPDAMSQSLPQAHYRLGLGFSDFARHYSRNHFCFLFLRVLRCFSSPGSLHIPIYSVCDNTMLLVLSSLIRISTDLRIFAPPRSFSQLVTSFFGAMYQGILRKPFVA